MRGGSLYNTLRRLGRPPVISTPLIRNAFELGHCVSKPIKQGCLSPPSKQKQYFLLGLSSAFKEQAASVNANFLLRSSSRVRISSAALLESKQEPETSRSTDTQNVDSAQLLKPDHAEVCHGYWSLGQNRFEDQSSRTWNSFKFNVDETEITKHRTPETFSDQFAKLTVMAMRFPTDLLFRKRYLCRAAMLETISGVPGMVGSVILHCKSLRRIENSGGWIKTLMEEAENERMHLMTFMHLVKPSWQERALIFTAQAVFMNVYSLLYVLSPRFAHRMVGYLTEEAIQSYTQLLRDIEEGKVENVPAPEVARDYWRLTPEASLKDVITSIRADEIYHREMNHYAADAHLHGRILKQAPVPVCSH